MWQSFTQLALVPQLIRFLRSFVLFSTFYPSERSPNELDRGRVPPIENNPIDACDAPNKANGEERKDAAGLGS